MKKRMLCMLLFCLCLLCACGTTQQTPQPSAEAQPYTPYWQYSQRYSTSGDGMVFLSTGDGVIQYKHLNAVAQPLIPENEIIVKDLIATDATVYAIATEDYKDDEGHIQSTRYGVRCIERATGQSKTAFLPEDAALSGLDNASINQLLYRDGILLALVSATKEGNDDNTYYHFIYQLNLEGEPSLFLRYAFDVSKYGLSSIAGEYLYYIDRTIVEGEPRTFRSKINVEAQTAEEFLQIPGELVEYKETAWIFGDGYHINREDDNIFKVDESTGEQTLLVEKTMLVKNPYVAPLPICVQEGVLYYYDDIAIWSVTLDGKERARIALLPDGFSPFAMPEENSATIVDDCLYFTGYLVEDQPEPQKRSCHCWIKLTSGQIHIAYKDKEAIPFSQMQCLTGEPVQ